MSGQEYQPGEVVDVLIKGVRIENPGVHSNRLDEYACYTSVLDEQGEEFNLPPQAQITRVAPPGWPPRQGDVWLDEVGDAWLAVAAGRLRDASGADPLTADYVLSTYGPMQRIHRRPSDGGDQS